MAPEAALDRDPRRRGRVYTILIAFDEEKLGRHRLDGGSKDAEPDVRRYLAERGFTALQRGLYVGDGTVDAVRSVVVVQGMAEAFAWFAPSLLDARLLRIEESSDLGIAL